MGRGVHSSFVEGLGSIYTLPDFAIHILQLKLWKITEIP